MATTPTKKINFATYFENLIIGLHVHYFLNILAKFCVNQMLFTIRSINLFLCIILDYKNLKFKYLIDNIVVSIIRYAKRIVSCAKNFILEGHIGSAHESYDT